MVSPLRPELYKRLKGRLGDVETANEGEEFRGSVTWNPARKCFDMQVIWPGEYYRVNCAFCNDTRKRLWINHRWALYVKELGSDNLWLAICFNENCLSVPGRARQLRDLVFDDFLRGHQLDLVRPGRAAPRERVREARWPGVTYPLHQLPADHPACLYLRGRGFDPAWLGEKLQVAYCSHSEDWCRQAQGRIIIPIFRHGQLVGWQGRLIGQPASREVPKYFSMPGMARRQLLYNLDVARAYPHVVVCEGPTDVWRFGPEAVALLGKQSASLQRDLIRTYWRDGVVVILLDANAKAEARGIAETPELRGIDTVVVTLPDGCDPGGVPTLWLRDYVFRQVRAKGIHVGIREVKLEEVGWSPTSPLNAHLPAP